MTKHPHPGSRLPTTVLAAVFLVLEVAACVRAVSPPQEAPPAAPQVAPPAPVQAAPPAPVPAPSPAPVETFPEPIEVSSVGSLLDVRMQVVRATFNLPGGGGTQSLRAYQLLSANGRTYNAAPAFPGPTFRVRPGDRVRIKLLNRLTNPDTLCMNYPAAVQKVDTFPDCFHGPDWTNIHFHGFHVTPADSGDNVLLEIAPGDSFQYSFRIPSNQSPGTHWYHPHKHGSVALQVTNGMSGAFFVEDTTRGLDSLARAYRMEDYLVAIQQVDSSVNLVDNVAGNTVLVNGQSAPVLPLRPGEVARLRIVNENIAQTAHYQLLFPSTNPDSQPAFYDVARDGVQLAPANYDPASPDDSLYMAPGNRLDVFVKAPGAPGDYALHARPLTNRRNARRPSRKEQEPAVAAQLHRPLVVFRVVAPGTTAYNTSLPPALPPLPGFLANVGRTSAPAVVVFTDSLTYQTRNPTGQPTRFFLGNVKTPYMQFDPSRVYYPTSATGARMPMVLADSQSWTVLNYSTALNHPFHIHINPFQVLAAVSPNPADPFKLYYTELNAAAAPRPAGKNAPLWMDVVPLPQASWVKNASGTDSTLVPGSVTIRQRYDDFDGCRDCGSPTGKFVMHCHILGHEERGMMQLIQIFPSRSAVPRQQAGRGGGGHRH